MSTRSKLGGGCFFLLLVSLSVAPKEKLLSLPSLSVTWFSTDFWGFFEWLFMLRTPPPSLASGRPSRIDWGALGARVGLCLGSSPSPGPGLTQG